MLAEEPISKTSHTSYWLTRPVKLVVYPLPILWLSVLLLQWGSRPFLLSFLLSPNFPGWPSLHSYKLCPVGAVEIQEAEFAALLCAFVSRLTGWPIRERGCQE